MATRVSSASELQSALESASGGDTILLESGDYGWLDLQNLKFDDHVTIKSADGDGGARFKHITLEGSDHIKLDSLTIEFGPSENHNDKAIDIRDSHHIQVVNSEIIGNASTRDWSDAARGVEVWQNSSNIELSDNHIHHFARAAFFFGDHMTIKNNLINDIRLDGLFFGNSNNLLIENNTLTDFYRQGTDHADYIQFDPGTSGAARDVIIRGNVMLKGNGNGDVQGIFGANHHADVHDSVFTNFLVEDNIYFDTGLNAIQFYTGENMTVRNNTVLADPADGRVVWVRLHGPQTNSIIEDNVATQVNADGGATASGNVIAQFRDPSNAHYYGDLFADPFADPITLEDLAPKAGALDSGKGAEQRFQELLGGSRSDTSDSETAVASDGSAGDDAASDDSAGDDSVDASSADDEPTGDDAASEDSAGDDVAGDDVAGDDVANEDSTDEDSADDTSEVDRSADGVEADTDTGNERQAAFSFGQDEQKLDLKDVPVDSNSDAEPVMAGQEGSEDRVAGDLADMFEGSVADVALDEEPAGGDADDVLLS